MKIPEKVIVIQEKKEKRKEESKQNKQGVKNKGRKKERNRTNRTCFKRQMLGRELIGLRGRGDFLYLFFLTCEIRHGVASQH